ncbi:MAG TPA: hypothetical protein DCS97_12795 [Planctomycetes bacterium]|nr:hypothetical protein [Planctomycetota bacterium]
MSRPPNILLITADEMRGDCAGFMGAREVSTPHLDALAGRGTVLANHFSPFPKCVPSRIAMMTGRHCHADGYRTIHQHMPVGTPNVLGSLRAAGWQTAVLGLNHAWEGLWVKPPQESVADWHSFSGAELEALAFRPVTLPEPGPQARTPYAYDSQACGWLRSQRLAGTIGAKGSPEPFCDENRADQAFHFLRRLRDPAKPFYLQLNLSKPHPSYEAPEPWFSRYDPEHLTPFPHALPEHVTLPFTAQRQYRVAGGPPERALRELQAVYYSMISWVDSLIGRVLAALDAEGLSDSTLVVFTSDHGDFAGQYGLHEKWDTVMADCLLRVPFAIAGPGIPRGARRDLLTSHVDLPRALLAAAGLAPDWNVHGGDLSEAVAGRAIREAVFADGGHEREMRDRFANGDPERLQDKQLCYHRCRDAMARTAMVRTSDWKLVVRETGGDELYDLTADPWELRNLHPRLADDQELTRRALDLSGLLQRHLLATMNDQPRQQQVHA